MPVNSLNLETSSTTVQGSVFEVPKRYRIDEPMSHGAYGNRCIGWRSWVARWWNFNIFFIFIPKIGGFMIQFDYRIFFKWVGYGSTTNEVGGQGGFEKNWGRFRTHHHCEAHFEGATHSKAFATWEFDAGKEHLHGGFQRKFQGTLCGVRTDGDWLSINLEILANADWWSLSVLFYIRFYVVWNMFIQLKWFIVIWSHGTCWWIPIVTWRSVISAWHGYDSLIRSGCALWLSMYALDGIEHLRFYAVGQTTLVPLIVGPLAAS